MIRRFVRGWVGMVGWVWRYGIRLMLWCVLIVLVLPRSVVPVGTLYQRVSLLTAPHYFDYLSWEAGAIGAKTQQWLFGLHWQMREDDRSDFVRDYLADVGRWQVLNREIEALYQNPTVDDADVETAALRQERDALRADIDLRQSTAEAILEGQVAAVLVDAGFGMGGQLLPPMAMRFTELPYLLVVSPRDDIRREIDNLTLRPLAVDERELLENTIDETYDVSSLILPLGGIALYPAMITETASVSRAVEVYAHEWLHHYLYFYPLGLSYFSASGGEALVINETVADYFGKEIARTVLQRYYPEQPVPELPIMRVEHPAETVDTLNDAAPVFDFRAEMRETRVMVDDLLLAGEVEAAEAYMEERRLFFYENGYGIRKLNQAFFAFYGSYQAGGGQGAGGADPTGNLVIGVREASDSIYDFVVNVRGVTDLDSLEFSLQALRELDK